MNEETENNAPEALNIDPMAAMPEDPMDSASEAPTAVVDAPAEPEPVQRAVSQEADAHGWWRGTGRRKTAVARVRIKAGSGTFKVNDRDLDVYFTEERDLKNIKDVLAKTNTSSSLEVHVRSHGGGFMGQAGAVILGLGRALLKYDASLEPILRSNGFLTRDARQVERKKYGQPGARKRFQFSKR
jgi:small subunit ribosomal protein S9